MEYTTNLNLKKPDINEYYNIVEQENENADIIDEAIGKLNSDVGTEELTTEAQDCKGAINELNKKTVFEKAELTKSANVASGTLSCTFNGLGDKKFRLSALKLTEPLTNGENVVIGNIVTEEAKPVATFDDSIVGSNGFVGRVRFNTDGSIILYNLSVAAMPTSLALTMSFLYN